MPCQEDYEAYMKCCKEYATASTDAAMFDFSMSSYENMIIYNIHMI